MLATNSLVTLLLAWGIQILGADVQPPSDREIREMLQVDDQIGGEQRTLIAFGEQLFPAYLRILAAKDVKPTEVTRIFSMLTVVKADRSRFHEHAVDGLAHSRNGVRRSAVALLAEIGGERDTAPIHALLSDGDFTVGVAAVKTIQAIGGPRDLAALNTWLAVSNDKRYTPEYRKQYEILREYVTKSRDGLKERLDKEKEKTKKPKL